MWHISFGGDDDDDDDDDDVYVCVCVCVCSAIAQAVKSLPPRKPPVRLYEDIMMLSGKYIVACVMFTCQNPLLLLGFRPVLSDRCLSCPVCTVCL